MFFRICEKFEESLSLILFLLIFVLMTMGVINRYVFGHSFSWNIELCRYSFVWLTFVGAAFVRKEDTHIKIEIVFNLLSKKMSPGTRKAIWVFKLLITVAYLALLSYLAFVLASKSWRFKSQAMQISQFFLYISVSLGAFLYLLREISGSLRHYRTNFAPTANPDDSI